jgi:hypothetical protein
MSTAIARRRTALPTFVVIGALKCGTTSLQHYLVQHPQIQMPPRKETDFFSGPPNGAPYATGYKRVERLDEYERLFDPEALARGEASPNYTVHPVRRDTPRRMNEAVPDAKLIYLVRDPVSRTISHYHHRVSVENERRTLDEALGDFADPYSLYTCASRYALQLELYLQYYPQDQIMIVDQADLRSRRAATLAEIFSFLSVDTSFVSSRFDEEINTERERRTYSDFIVWVRRAQASPLQRLPRPLRVALRQTGERLLSKPLAPPVVDEALRHRLRELYVDEAERLRMLTGKTFSTWTV